MSDNIEPTPSDSETPAEAGPPSSRTLRERFGAMTEGRRSFLTGLAVGAAVLGGAWGVTSALDGDSDHDHHRGGRMDKGGHHRDRGGHGDMGGHMGDHMGGGMDGHSHMDGERDK